MYSGICLPEIYITNLMGILMCILLLTDARWKIGGSRLEKRIIKVMAVFTLIVCCADPLVFTMDGRPGLIPYLCIYIGNFIMFATHLVICLSWCTLLFYHNGIEPGRVRVIIYVILCIAGAAALLLNSFVPLVYAVSSDNVYSRGFMFWYYDLLAAVMVIDSVLLYYREKRRGKLLKFFSIQQFLIPISVAIVLQSFCYGLSIVWPFLAVSLTALNHSLQNEMLYRDGLTGLYNRLYLDTIMTSLEERGRTITAMMMDLNGFKMINDTYGHGEGDEALKIAAELLRNSVESSGSVIRYAGDEFIVLLTSDDIENMQNMMRKINDGFARFSESGEKPYPLSVSIGGGVFDMKGRHFNEIMNDIDEKMYLDKKRFYEEHVSADRRGRRRAERAAAH